MEAPKTAFTFNLLDTIMVMTARGRISVYDYYMGLRCLTDNGELDSFPVSTPPLIFYLFTDCLLS